MDLMEALTHVPRGKPASPQNELRMVFTILRQAKDRNGVSTAKVLGEALAEGRRRHPGYEFDVDAGWFQS